MNEDIRARKVRLIGSDGQQVGIVPLEEALARAEEDGEDLVEVAPNADPPVCKIIDYKKLLYEQKRKMRDSRKKAKQVMVKEVKMTPKTEEHDYNFKLSHARKFISGGDKVKASIFFRGRQVVHKELGRVLLERMERDLSDIAEPEGEKSFQGRNMSVIFAPKRD